MIRKGGNNSHVPEFDDALPERLMHEGVGPDVRSLRLEQGTGKVSPYIVKLTREDIAPPADLSSELEALAKSLIIEADEADTLTSVDGGLMFDGDDAREQLREFDSVVPTAVALPRKAQAPVRQFVSLDEALAQFIDPFDVKTMVEPKVVSVLTDDAIFTPIVTIVEETVVETHIPVVSVTTPRRLTWLPHSFRALGAFVGLSFAVVLPLHAMQTFAGTEQSAGEISDIGKSALEDLSRGAAALSDRRFDLAKSDFSRAAEKFSEAEASLGELHSAVVAVVNVIPETDRTYASVRGLVLAGKELSQTASIMSDAGTDIAQQESLDLVTKLELLSAYVESSVPHAETAATALDDVDPAVVPVEYAEKVAELKAKAPAVAASMREFLHFIDTLSTMLGGEEKMRYLAAFQNNTELRPTGGFVGSFAEVDVKDGAIADLKIPGGGSYDVQGQLQAFVQAPQPLSLINARWEFQDANWFPDFPTSARKMQWFYEQSGGPSTDGVIAVNATFMVELLKILGPVEMPEYGRTIDAENFMFETQKIVELEYDKEENAPKAFIGDLAPVLLERVTDADLDTLLSVLHLVETSLRQKDILVTFTSNELQSAMTALDWTGAIKQTEGDYLMVVNTNIGGGKTDSVIDQSVDVQVDVQDDGSVINTVTVTKVHRGIASALFSGRNNVDYLRVYVPEGSTLLSADGFEAPPDELFEHSELQLLPDEDLTFLATDQTKDAASGVDIWNEFDKTVFGQWMQTAPGETEVVTFVYRLPFSLAPEAATDLVGRAKEGLGIPKSTSYSMFVQKQPGVQMRETDISLALPTSWDAVWSTNGTGSDAALTAEVNNASDAFFGWLIMQK